jgi:tripartite-type tricarboxylate transporter receptor subunit TctC
MVTRRHLVTAAAAAVTVAVGRLGSPALAQGAGKAARILVGFPPAGGADIVARLLAREMTSYVPSIIVENRPGGGGRIALDVLKGSAADGSVMTLTPASLIVLFPHVYKSLNYDSLRDFIPVTSVCTFPYLLTVGPMVPREVRTVADFVSWCRANPAQSTYGTPGSGSPLHFIGVLLSRTAGFEFLHVPYQGAAPALQDLLGGRIAAFIGTMGATLPQLQSQSGQLRALATTSPQRSALLPDVPTFTEAGYPALEVVEWYGVFVPAKTPTDTVARLNNVIRDALKTSEVKAGLARLSLDIAGASPAEFAQLVEADFKRWGPIVKASGFTPAD